MIRDYHWMINVIKEMRAEMIIGAKTAQYGIKATLLKAAGGVSDPIMLEAIRRSKNIKRVAEYEKRLLEVQNLVDKDSSDREVEVLNWMLDGRSKRWIGQIMGLSHTYKTDDGVIEGVLICPFYASMVSIKNLVISVFSAFVLASQKSLRFLHFDCCATVLTFESEKIPKFNGDKQLFL